jgi:hypothetical protein
MRSNGNGSFSITLAGNNVPGHANVQRAVWMNQLEAIDRNGKAVGCSQTYNDVAFSHCSSTVTPTARIKLPIQKLPIKMITRTPPNSLPPDYFLRCPVE